MTATSVHLLALRLFTTKQPHTHARHSSPLTLNRKKRLTWEVDFGDANNLNNKIILCLICILYIKAKIIQHACFGMLVDTIHACV